MSLTTSSNGNGLLLYLHKYSFYAQKVTLALHEKKLPFKSVVIDITKGEQYDPEFLKINPRGEVPALRDGVKVIPDSARIIDYLEDNFTNNEHPRLTPVDSAERQKMKQMRELIDRIPANSVTMGSFYHTEDVCGPKLPFIRPIRLFMKAGFEKTSTKLRKLAEAQPEYRDVLLQKAQEHDLTYATVTNKEKFKDLLSTVDDTLDKVEEQLESQKDKQGWLINKDFTVADVALTTLLYRLDVIGMSHRFFHDRPQVSAYLGRVANRDSYKATFPGLFYHFKALLGFK
ncbi:ganglioside-induced differentiation-associated protein 1 isoform X2 [Cimex lectularius]|nr:ganglioside-induced differentiation-associated protein 1 isoform X2 [Cimex lectularius]